MLDLDFSHMDFSHVLSLGVLLLLLAIVPFQVRVLRDLRARHKARARRVTIPDNDT